MPTGAPASGYPRACGGTSYTNPSVYPRSGLSPRVRGNLITIYNNTIGKRSIPARAGEPVKGIGLLDVLEVYPRACGGTAFTARTIQR